MLDIMIGRRIFVIPNLNWIISLIMSASREIAMLNTVYSLPIALTKTSFDREHAGHSVVSLPSRSDQD